MSASSLRAQWDAQSILGDGGKTIHQSVTLLPWEVGTRDQKGHSGGKSYG